jgi:hypothetical protein
MQLADFARILAIAYNLIVGLVPGCHCRELWPGKLGEGMKVQPV